MAATEERTGKGGNQQTGARAAFHVDALTFHLRRDLGCNVAATALFAGLAHPLTSIPDVFLPQECFLSSAAPAGMCPA